MINTKITSTNLSVSPTVEEYVSKKIKSLEKFLDTNKQILYEVELGKTTNHHKSGDIYLAEINITCDGKQYFVSVEKDDLYAAIDEMRDEAEKVIISKRKKFLTTFRRGASKVKEAIRRFYK